MTCTDEMIAAAFASVGEHGAAANALRALLDERAALRANADAVAKERLAYKDAHGPWADLTTQDALNAELTRLTAERDEWKGKWTEAMEKGWCPVSDRDALTRRCERLREALRYIAEGEWSADHARSQARAALAADEKEK